jgi:hypothetical protein
VWLQSFEGREQRDSAMAVPDNYEPPNFQTVALQHTNVQLTWDADDDGRKRALSAKRATQMEIREDDFKALACPDMQLNSAGPLLRWHACSVHVHCRVPGRHS